MRLEDQLRTALRRQEPPAGFAKRVLARATAETRVIGFTRKRLLWLAAASLTAALAGSAISAGIHRRQEETAGRQALLALRIAAEKLDAARAKVLRRTSGVESRIEEN